MQSTGETSGVRLVFGSFFWARAQFRSPIDFLPETVAIKVKMPQTTTLLHTVPPLDASLSTQTAPVASPSRPCPALAFIGTKNTIVMYEQLAAAESLGPMGCGS